MGVYSVLLYSILFYSMSYLLIKLFIFLQFLWFFKYYCLLAAVANKFELAYLLSSAKSVQSPDRVFRW